MHKTKKTILIALAVILLLGATPAFAQWWVGDWKGEGTGRCYDGIVKMYPWQSWKGEILLATYGEFKGKWEDNITSTDGIFYLEYINHSSTLVNFKGYWKWYDSLGNLIYGGPAKMTLYNSVVDYGYGAWDATYFPPDPIPREMKGEKY